MNRVPVNGYEGVYDITDAGEVIRVGRAKSATCGRVLKARVGKIGYYTVDLWRNNKGTTKYIHRLLAEAFIPNPKNLPTVNHKDGDKTNNALENLEWVSYADNNKHAYDTGLKVVSDNVRRAMSKTAKEYNEKRRGTHYGKRKWEQ